MIVIIIILFMYMNLPEYERCESSSTGNLLFTNCVWLQSEEQENAPSALISISKKSKPMCRTAGQIFSGLCVGCFWSKGKKSELSLCGVSRESPKWNVPKNN